MQISSRFTIAVHVLVCIETFKYSHKITSDLLASSVNVNPVVIRRLMQQLKAAGIISVARGTGGMDTARPVGEITLLDVYRAVESVDGGGLFRFHENPNQLCPVGRNIHSVLDGRLSAVQRAMEEQLGTVTLGDVLGDIRQALAKENR